MRYLALILFFAVSLLACKKDAKLPNNNSLASTNDTNLVVFTHADSLAMFGDSCYGNFTVLRTFLLSSNNTLNPYGSIDIHAFLSDSLFQYPLSWSYVMSHSQYVNNIDCNYYPLEMNSDGFYRPYLPVNGISAPVTWTISGNNVLPGFTFTNPSTPFPFYGGYMSLPDTIHLNNGFSSVFNGFLGASYVGISIFDTNNHYIRKQNYTYASSLNVSYTADELAILDTINDGYIEVALLRDTTILVAGKPFYFSNITLISNPVDFK